ncbi:MAG: cupredoxin domain-containing protein [Gaiellaceae bacterium]
MRNFTVVVMLLSVFLVAGCGGDDNGGEETTSTASQTISISATDFAFTPSTVTVDAPGTYTFDLTNDGGTDHALEIEGNGVEEETDTVSPGDTASVTVDLESGSYEMYCPIDGHRAQGMEGEISVS